MRQWRTVLFGEFLSSLRSFDWAELRYASACGYWPLAVYFVVCIGGALLVLLIAGLVLLPGQITSWQSAGATSSALTGEHDALLVQAVTNSARNLSIASQCVQCPYLHKHLHVAKSMPVVVDSFKNIAAARGITISALRPQQLWRQESVHAYEIDIQVRANRNQLVNLLSDIERMGSALAIRQIDWQLASSRVQMTLLLQVDHRYAVPDTVVADDMLSANSDDDWPGVSDYARQVDSDADWQRVAYIKRGNRYLEVQRDARGEIRRRIGKLPEAGQ